ncbi:MAG: hypothetical protein H6822_16150 [Planctomycetaceae bacterium]|nr:hypothetical protein [Planctomycetales bacterium]MCB9923714.1 hypothetical protein [Planctomycetaceae bacterium]
MMRRLDSQLRRQSAARGRGLTVGMLVGLTLCLATVNNSASQEQAWEYAPYKVRIWLATDVAGELDQQVRQSLSFALMQKIEAFIGAPWDAEVTDAPETLRSSMLLDTDLITSEILETCTPEALNGDKIILLTIRVNPRELHVEAREIDCRTRLHGVSVRRIVRQPELLESVCFEAITRSFRAITRLEEGGPKYATVRIRAGGLVLDKASPCYVGTDDILLPIQRNNDRAGMPSRIVPIEWTFLQVQTPDATNPYLMTSRVWSGKPNPVTGKSSPRKERYALKVIPTAESTTLQVMSRVLQRGEEPYPMPGLEVYAKAPEPDPTEETEAPNEDASAANPEGSEEAAPTDEVSEEVSEEKPAEPDATEKADSEPPPPLAKSDTPKVSGDPAELLGRTDWNGTLEIGQSDTLLRIIYLKNGAQLLARLPMVPGLEPLLVASVPDDAPRLQAEGFVKGLQGQLMDLEAQREILKARFMLRIEEATALSGDEKVEKLKEAQTLLEEIKQLPTRNDLVRQLDAQQGKQIISPVKSVQSRIDQLYAKMREALGKYLSPSLVNSLTNTLNDARR